MNFGFLLFNDLEELDLVGPWEMISVLDKMRSLSDVEVVQTTDLSLIDSAVKHGIGEKGVVIRMI